MLTYETGLLDASNLVWRCFVNCNTEEETRNISLSTVQKFTASIRDKLFHTTSRLLFLFDNPTSGIKRRQIADPEYKAHRAAAPLVYFRICDDFKKSVPARDVVRCDGHEADDLLEPALRSVHKRPAVVVSTDLDWARVIDSDIHWYDLKQAWTPESFADRHGFHPPGILLWKTFRGDPADNIPVGCPGLGVATVKEIVTRCMDLDEAFAYASGYPDIMRKMEKHHNRLTTNWDLVKPCPPENFSLT